MFPDPNVSIVKYKGLKWPPTPVFLPGKSPRTEEPGRVQSMRSKRVGQDRDYNSSEGLR